MSLYLHVYNQQVPSSGRFWVCLNLLKIKDFVSLVEIEFLSTCLEPKRFPLWQIFSLCPCVYMSTIRKVSLSGRFLVFVSTIIKLPSLPLGLWLRIYMSANKKFPSLADFQFVFTTKKFPFLADFVSTCSQLKILFHMYIWSTQTSKSNRPMAILWSKMAFLIWAWQKENVLSRPWTPWIQIKHNQTFKMRYITSLNSHWFQNDEPSKSNDRKKRPFYY